MGTPARPLRATTTPTPEQLLLQARRLTRAEQCRFLLLLQAELLGREAAAGLSRPRSVSAWARAFGVGRAVMGGWLRGGAVEARRCGTLWRIAVADLPAGPP